jgi:hypothetical protein
MRPDALDLVFNTFLGRRSPPWHEGDGGRQLFRCSWTATSDDHADRGRDDPGLLVGSNSADLGGIPFTWTT